MNQEEFLIMKKDFLFKLKNSLSELENKYQMIFPEGYIHMLEDENYSTILEDYIFATEDIVIAENQQMETNTTSPKLIAIGMTGDYDILTMLQDKNSKEIYLYMDGDFNLPPERIFPNYQAMFEEFLQEDFYTDIPEEFYSLVITQHISDKKEMLQLKNLVKYPGTTQEFLKGLRSLPFTVKENINSALRDILEKHLKFISGKFEFRVWGS